MLNLERTLETIPELSDAELRLLSAQIEDDETIPDSDYDELSEAIDEELDERGIDPDDEDEDDEEDEEEFSDEDEDDDSEIEIE